MKSPGAQLTSRLLLRAHRPWYIWLSVCLALVLAVGALEEGITEHIVERRYPAPGEMIDVGGYQLHLNCSGQGSPAVILEAGVGGWSTYWYAVQPPLSKLTRVCSYDRAGYGWSQASNRPRTLGNMVDDLHQLLVRGKVEGPYILVGHSLGGIVVQQFVADYPDDVAGMVLVDSSHEEQRIRLQSLTGESVRSYPVKEWLGAALSYVGVTRMVLPMFDPGNDKVPEDIAKTIVDVKAKPLPMRTQFIEARDLDIYFAEARENQAHALVVPLIVLTGLKGRSTDDQKFWTDLQVDIAHRSPLGEQRSIREAGHYIQWDQPNEVVSAVKKVLQATSEP